MHILGVLLIVNIGIDNVEAKENNGFGFDSSSIRKAFVNSVEYTKMSTKWFKEFKPPEFAFDPSNIGKVYAETVNSYTKESSKWLNSLYPPENMNEQLKTSLFGLSKNTKIAAQNLIKTVSKAVGYDSMITTNIVPSDIIILDSNWCINNRNVFRDKRNQSWCALHSFHHLTESNSKELLRLKQTPGFYQQLQTILNRFYTNQKLLALISRANRLIQPVGQLLTVSMTKAMFLVQQVHSLTNSQLQCLMNIAHSQINLLHTHQVFLQQNLDLLSSFISRTSQESQKKLNSYASVITDGPDNVYRYIRDSLSSFISLVARRTAVSALYLLLIVILPIVFVVLAKSFTISEILKLVFLSSWFLTWSTTDDTLKKSAFVIICISMVIWVSRFSIWKSKSNKSAKVPAVKSCQLEQKREEFIDNSLLVQQQHQDAEEEIIKIQLEQKSLLRTISLHITSK
ncbi:hypothetical protein HDV02_001445 [Globomyces sp. JEL0801]|nr:hypothetical protein HDV02_001445 [Globomyces sp. JEL0801]